MLSTVEWGSVSEWVSGIATVVAVTSALVFSLRSEHEQRDSRLAAVYSWFEITRAENNLSVGTLWLTNNTDSPIYEWTVLVSWPRTETPDQQTAATGSRDHGLLPPGKHPFEFSAPPEAPLPANDSVVHVELSFVDAQGRQRRRTSSGKLFSGRRA